MPTKRIQPTETPPDLPPEKAYLVLNAQLERLQSLKGRNYQEAKPDEDEWIQLTEKLVLRSFGSGSGNYGNIRRARSAGVHQIVMYDEPIPHARYQSNFQARQQAYESALKSCIAEIEIDLPDNKIQGVYEPGEEYEFYRDVTACLKLAHKEIFVIDPYLNMEIFDVYARAIQRTVSFRLLSANIASDVITLAKKYAAGGNFSFQSSTAIHDRVLFADNRVWLSGQSLKDAARKKPTYIVEHDEPLMRPIYEQIWSAASSAI